MKAPLHRRFRAFGCAYPRRRASPRQSGFTYLGLLFVVLAFGLALASVALVWRTAVQRDKETELLFVGKQYRQAIGSYYASGQREFPVRLEDLLADPRFPQVKRHLRRLYRDPMTGKPEWGLVKVGDRIVGVYSLGTGAPLREVPTGSADDPPIGGTSYSEWKFVVDPRTQSQAAVQPDPQAPVPLPGPGGQPDPQALVPLPGPGGQPGPQALPQLPAPGPGMQPVQPDPEIITMDPCEQEQEATIASCGAEDPAQNPDFERCLTEALQQFQRCKGGG